MARAGLVHVGNDHVPPSYRPLVEGLAALGWDERRNIRYAFHNVADEAGALAVMRTFARERVDVVVAFDTEACEAARAAAVNVPVVMMHVGDPVAAGFAKTLARPGGNMTGFAGRVELPAKELEILREMAPRVTRVLLLYDSLETASGAWREAARASAKRLGFSLVERDAADADAVARAFEKLRPGEVEAVLFAANGIRHRHLRAAIDLAGPHRLLVVGNRRDLVVRGALFCYAYDYAKVGRASAARYVDPILRGANPRDLPIEEVTEYSLTVNVGVARRAGLAIPPSIRALAGEVID